MLGHLRNHRRVARPAYAKVNLALSVGGPEPVSSPKPGFHRIASWMACIDLADEVIVEPAPDDRPTQVQIGWAPGALRPSPIDWPVERDLAARAHRLIEEHCARPLPATITVRKRIPAGGGLGGGSSDAAAALLAVNSAFGLGIPAPTLSRLGSTLGSDVPFFIDPDVRDTHPPRPALVEGFGDQIERLPPIHSEILLIAPPFMCPTSGVYAAYDRLLDGRLAIPSSVHETSRPTLQANEPLVRLLIRRAFETRRLDPDACFNGLTAPAVHLEPRVASVITTVTEVCGIQAHLTGSGSCVFVLGEMDQLAEAEARLSASIQHREGLRGCTLLRTHVR